MRSKLSLPQHPNILFLIIVFDILALVVAYGLYSTNWVGTTGVPVRLSEQAPQNLPIPENSITLEIFPPPSQNCILNKRAIAYADLKQELETEKEKLGSRTVLLMIDQSASVAQERNVLAIIRDLRLRCLLVAEPSLESE